MRSGSVAQQRMRLVMGLTVAGAGLLACGVMLVLVGSILRLTSPHQGRGFVHAGEAVAGCGLAFGVGLIVVLIIDLADRAGRGGQGGSRKGSGPRPASGGPIALPPPETGLAELRQEPIVELKLASRYPRPDDPDNRWQPDAGHGSYPHPDHGSEPQADGSWSRGPAYVWSPRDDWAGSGEGGWGPAGQGDWGDGGQHEWAPADPGDLSSGGPPGWAAAGQDGWARGGDHGWGFAEPAGSWIDPAAPGESAGAPATSGEESESVDGPQLTDVAGPGVTAEPTQLAPSAIPSVSVPDIAVTKSAGSYDGALDDTAPLPVIRDVSPPGPKTAEDEPHPAAEPGQNQPAPFSVFEPAPRRSVFEPGPKRSVFEPGPAASERDRRSARGNHPDDAGQRPKAGPLPAETEAKLEQIKDLYLTAEAIGEDALVKYFDQLSQRQRSLIREFFDRAGLGSSGTSARLSGDPADDGVSPPNGESTQDSAPLPG